MQCGPDLLVFKDPSEPRDLIRRLKKRVITVKGRVLSFHDIIDFPRCFGSYVPNSLKMLWNEQELVRIDMSRLDESAGLFWAATWVLGVHQSALVIHEAVEVAAGPGQTLTKVVGSHLQDLSADSIAGAKNRTECEDQSLLAVETEQHAHRAAVLGFFDQEGHFHGHAMGIR